MTKLQLAIQQLTFIWVTLYVFVFSRFVELVTAE